MHRRRDDGSWEGVAPRAYEGGRRHDLITGAGYRVRYFEVAPGGHTALETHAHDHTVVIERGRARVTLGDERHELGPGDVVYVAPDELHGFEAIGDAPLGFICVASPAVTAERGGS